MEKKGTLASPATALASRVFPVPGGPTSGLLQTGYVLEGHLDIVLLLIELGLGLADVEDAASRASAHVLLHRPEHNEPQQSE